MEPLRPDWAADDIDPKVPSPARVYDHMLGGFSNFDVDRRVTRQMTEIIPEIPQTARANRAFMRRAVSYLVDAGVDQFLDLGSGIPTAGNVHEIARRSNPDARVVYVDVDPVAVTMGRRLLADDPGTVAVYGDLTDLDSILSHPDVSTTLDFGRPVAVLLVSVLHFVRDDDVLASLVARLRQRLVTKSFLVISHLTDEGPPDLIERFLAVTADVAGRGDRLRRPHDLLPLFDGFTLVEPGLVHLADWRPETDEHNPVRPFDGYAAVGMRN